MPVYTYINENENQHSDEAVALVETAIQSVLNESLADRFSKVGAGLDKAGAKVKNSAEYLGNAAKGFALMGKEKAAEKKEAAKGARNVAKSVADEKKAQKSASADEASLRKAAKALEDKKARQGGELLPSEQDKLDRIWNQIFAMEDNG